jgi:hypothetical protein
MIEGHKMCVWLAIMLVLAPFMNSTAEAAWSKKPGVTYQAPVGVFSTPNCHTFEDHFHIKLRLPIPEARFLSLIEKLHLDYVGYGPDVDGVSHSRHLNIVAGSLQVVRNYDMTDISHFYVIRGADYDFHGGWLYFGANAEHDEYTVLVNRHHMVVYFENDCALSGGL